MQLLLLLAIPFAVSGFEADRYIVIFEDPPVPLFKGASGDADPKLAALLPTSEEASGRSFDDNIVAVDAYRAYLSERRSQVVAQAKRGGIDTPAPLLSLDFALNAVVLDLRPEQAALLRKQPGIVNVVADGVSWPLTDAGPEWVGAHAFWEAAPAGASQGESVVIGIIDTGINPSHPAFAGTGPEDGYLHQNPFGAPLGLCTGSLSCNGKLVGMFDFTTGSESAEPDDGLDVHGHGSHVAAIAAGNLIRGSVDVGSEVVPRELSGVAPHANLISYKACEDEAGCFDSWLLAAIDQAIVDGVDVINFSIGGKAHSPWSGASPTALAHRAARAAGIVVVVSAGNAGPGRSTIKSPANAPWVVAVANTSHRRRVANRVVEFVGNAAAIPDGGALMGQGDTGDYGPARIVAPLDHPGCGIGLGLGLGGDNEPNGSSNPWSGQPNRFSGEIVVCERGTHARIAKSDNVRRAGGGGMILVNAIADGESVVADPHSIPGTHLGFSAGQALKTWLAGGGQQARIEGARLTESDALADLLENSSSRGPVTYGDVLKPDISAPGAAILAAAGSGNGLFQRTGTSMAAPHVAGAAALLKSARPQWNVSQIESALLTTAVPVVRAQNQPQAASPLEQGAGRLAVDTALQAGIYLALDDVALGAADPAAGGDPGMLNRVGLQHGACRLACSLVRTVTDMRGGGSWRVEAELEGAVVTAMPATFSLASGASRALRFDIDLVDLSAAGQWLTGRVRLVPEHSDSAVAELPLAVFADPGDLPGLLEIDAGADSGKVDIVLDGLVGFPNARFEAGALVRPQVDRFSLGQDPTPQEPFDRFGPGTVVKTHTLPAAIDAAPRTFVLTAATESDTARDVDLYLGIDFDGDGLPDADEETCRSISAGASEQCEVEIGQTSVEQTLWVLAQGFATGSSGGDLVRLESRLMDPLTHNSGGLVATGPGTTATDQAFTLRLAWDDPGLLAGELRYALLDLYASDDLGPAATILVRLRARDDLQRSVRALVPGRTTGLRLQPGEAQDGLFIDVPVQGGSLVIDSVGGSAASLHASRVDSDAGPHVGRAPPRTDSDFSADSGIPLVVEGDALVAGRWFITPQNDGAGLAEISLTVDHRNSSSIQPNFGAWYNPERSGAGVYLYEAGSAWVVVWYTYLEDGTPTWYLGTAPAPEADAGHWVAALTRHSWNGERDVAVGVGEVVIALESAERMRFAWNLDGSSGSERLQWIGGRGCQAGTDGPEDIGGLWYDPGESGHGLSLEADGLEEGLLEVAALYLYDGKGRARWVQASGLRQADQQSHDLLQYLGSCPLCTHQPAQPQAIGSLQLDFAGAGTIDATGALEFAAPLAGDWPIEHRVVPISQTLGCPQP